MRREKKYVSVRHKVGRLVMFVAVAALLAEGNLEEYVSYVNAIVFCAGELYASRGSRPPRALPDRSAYRAETPALWCTLRDPSVKYDSVRALSGLLANIEPILAPIYLKSNSVIGHIYLAAEDGVMLGYDSHPDKSLEYFDYTQRDWYQIAKTAGGVIFSDPCQDGFGLGIMITCSAPFYDENGGLAGVVGMDILLNELNDNVMDVNIGVLTKWPKKLLGYDIIGKRGGGYAVEASHGNDRGSNAEGSLSSEAGSTVGPLICV